MGGAARPGGDRLKDSILALLAEHRAAGTPCVLATVVRCEAPTSAHPGDQAVITADGRLVGWVGGSCSEPLVRREALRALAEAGPRLVRIRPAAEAVEIRTPGELTVATTCPSGGALEIFVEPQLPRPLLVVVGDTPAARTLLQLGGLVGFRTCAVHPGARAEDVVGADRLITALDLGELRGEPDCWVVVASMGHYDEAAVAAALELPDADVALVASRRRAAAVLDELRRSGIEEVQLARVGTPAGSHRGETQEEIALSALADIVARRDERHVAESQSTEAEPAGFAVDPVCAMTVETATAVRRTDAAGVEHAFCSIQCADRFAAAPASPADSVRG